MSSGSSLVVIQFAVRRQTVLRATMVPAQRSSLNWGLCVKDTARNIWIFQQNCISSLSFSISRLPSFLVYGLVLQDIICWDVESRFLGACAIVIPTFHRRSPFHVIQTRRFGLLCKLGFVFIFIGILSIPFERWPSARLAGCSDALRWWFSYYNRRMLLRLSCTGGKCGRGKVASNTKYVVPEERILYWLTHSATHPELDADGISIRAPYYFYCPLSHLTACRLRSPNAIKCRMANGWRW